jgi:DNA processing protein
MDGRELVNQLLDFSSGDPEIEACSPFLELGAYEAMWMQPNASFKTLREAFKRSGAVNPSELIAEDEARSCANQVLSAASKRGLLHFGLRLSNDVDFPIQALDAVEQPKLLYYAGKWDLIHSPKRVAVVGARKVSEDGRRRTKHLVRRLVDHEYTIFSGLAAGVDAEAHKTALEFGGHTVAVLGTPLSCFYPRENESLQKRLARDHLIVSQVPTLRYLATHAKNPTANRHFFPIRNSLMSALTEATVIVEASDTSGTLAQARAALGQGRRLFILNSCFENSALSWPRKFEQMGAVRIRDFDELMAELEA